MTFIIINSTKQIVGDPIACNRDRESTEVNVVNNWCYTRGIYSYKMERQLEGTRIPDVYLGLGHFVDQRSSRSNVWYQWVWFMLLLQAICFYFPRWLWKGFEGGKMALFISNMDYFSIAQSLNDEKTKENKKKIDIIVDYLYQTSGYNDWYAIKYFFCEMLALINVIFQMAVNQYFLRGEFWMYGYNWIKYMASDPTFTYDPMETVFPIQSKCKFTRFGASGGTENMDFLCILTINIFNQKIYMFCWFWFIFLAIALSFVIVFRLLLICCPLMRYYCCRFRFELSEKSRQQSRTLVINRLRLGDWFILYLLGQNIDPIIFCEILEKLCEKLEIDPNYPIEHNYSINEVSKM